MVASQYVGCAIYGGRFRSGDLVIASHWLERWKDRAHAEGRLEPPRTACCDSCQCGVRCRTLRVRNRSTCFCWNPIMSVPFELVDSLIFTDRQLDHTSKSISPNLRILGAAFFDRSIPKLSVVDLKST